MTLVKLDQKMRIRLPKKVSQRLRLRTRESLDVKIVDSRILITRPKKIDSGNDPVLRDMIERPMHSKIKVTRELLEKWEEELYA